MDPAKRWLLVTGGIIIGALVFVDEIIGFYVEWLWYASLGYAPVYLARLEAQLGCSLLFGGLYFALTFPALRGFYAQTSHLPVFITDRARQDLPFLPLLAHYLRPLVLLAPLALAAPISLAGFKKWDALLRFLHHGPFQKTDPIFNHDYAFYVFVLPFCAQLKSVAWDALLTVAAGAALILFLKRKFYLSPSGPVFFPESRRAASLLAAGFFLLFACDLYFARFDLLFKNSGVVTGISFADDYGRLPVLNLGLFLSLAGAAAALLNVYRSDFRRLLVAGALLGVVQVGGGFYPSLLQRFAVDPNELIREAPYIEHTVAATTFGFGLADMDAGELPGTSSLTAQKINANRQTIDNIRLWDHEPLLATLGQIQEIRTYYQFASADNDRYMLNGAYRQTLLSPRELLSSNLPNRTWINEHLTFTHGYGLALSPVNQVTPEGLPVLFIKDIPPQSQIEIKVERPEIYFGELTDGHVFVNTGTKEFDYPEGEKNVYRNYEGQGGIPIGSYIRKLALAAHFKTMKILFSDDITVDSRVLMHRNITERVKRIAPFLRLDHDPYLVISQGRLFWIYDAYTVSDRLPYAQRLRGIGNYVRNSVKIVIDAYQGSVDFYIADANDPIILSWQENFPGLFRDLKTMPEDLRAHTRYPVDLFAAQARVYATYHMKTPQVFYNKEDQWEVPEIDGRVMQPYYTIMRLPGKDHEEYILMLPFTPRGKSNLSAWMVGRSDGGHLGKLMVYTFPKQRLVYGPSQIVARINQDAEVSRQISLWDQRGSKVIQGTLLVIPIEESLIYVRPLYLKADAGKIPELKRVIVGYEDQIAMEPTLDEALRKIFPGLPPEKAEPEAKPRAAAPPAAPAAASATSTPGVTLKAEELARIREQLRQALASQKQLEDTLANYRGNIESLGKTLDKLTPLPEASAIDKKEGRL